MLKLYPVRLGKLSCKLLVTGLLLLAFPLLSIAQNGTPCYKPVTGSDKTVAPVQNGVLCLACTFISNPGNITDLDTSNFSLLGDLAGVIAGSGVSVKNNSGDYPAGWYAGYVLEFGPDLLSVGVLNSLRLETWLGGVKQEEYVSVDGLSVSLISGGGGRSTLNFKTTKEFDEIRPINTGAVNALSNIRVYNAMAFDPNCGVLDNNGICYDQIAGPSTTVSFNSGLLNVLSGVGNAENLIDGNKNTHASMVLPANLTLLTSAPYVAVTDWQRIYPAGTTAGFMIEKEDGLLGVNVLNAFKIETFLHGTLQESISFNPDGLLGVSLITGGSSDKKEISGTTTKPYNEVRLVIDKTVNVNLGTLKIYYAFESGSGCTECKTPWVNSSSNSNEYKIVYGDRDPSFLDVHLGTTLLGLNLGVLSNTDDMVNPSTTDYALYEAVLGVGAGVRITVDRTNGVDFPANTFAGFALSTGGGLLDLSLLSTITIRLYKDDGVDPVQTISGAGLLNLGLLGGNDINYVGGIATTPFDEMELTINAGVLSVAPTFKIYYAYTVLDEDGDGVPDCIDVCGDSGDESIDSDGDGLPDSCDTCDILDSHKSTVLDTDGDGIPDACDDDSDNDGIPDSMEDIDGDGDPTNDDTDGDGIPNYLDLDSDNDGILDLYESGISAALIASLDTDKNGVIDPSFTNTGNGFADQIENAATPYGNGTNLADTDGDGVPDYIDLDSDNDGVLDLYEGNPNGAALDADGNGMVDGGDTDNDGIKDAVDGNNNAFGSGPIAATPIDTDGDGVPDYRDLDSDNDGVLDIYEGNGSLGATLDTNGDGMVDGVDEDGDGIKDAVDGAKGQYASAGTTAPPDKDGDGIPNMRDLDSDNDGVFDSKEGGLSNDLDSDADGIIDGVDTDGDGIRDAVDNAPGAFGSNGSAPLDTDGDGTPDYLDLDSDNDGKFDTNERLKVDLDADNDGMVDGVDTDGDGIVNVPELDDNNYFGGNSLETLPVRLNSFHALKGASDVTLNWTVAAEIYFSQYEVEESTDGINFKTIGIVLGAGEDKYSFRDKQVAQGMNYYRLKMVDQDGSFTYSPVVSVRFTSAALNSTTVKVAPNPVQHQYTVLFSQPQSGMYQFELRTVTGQLLMVDRIRLQESKQATMWRPAAVASGVYQLTIRNTATGKAETVKLIFR